MENCPPLPSEHCQIKTVEQPFKQYITGWRHPHRVSITQLILQPFTHGRIKGGLLSLFEMRANDFTCGHIRLRHR